MNPVQQIDVNLVINELASQIADLSRQNAILKATLLQYQKSLGVNPGSGPLDGAELETA